VFVISERKALMGFFISETTGYKSAEVCLNGHLTTGAVEIAPEMMSNTDLIKG